MRELKVGVLVPSSSILPMGKLFQSGLKGFFDTEEDLNVEIHAEFIGQGSIKTVEEAISKLVHFHGVNVITGIVSSGVIMELSEKIGKHTDVLFLINNLGEHVMIPDKVPANVLLNSPLLWQQLWAMGRWAVYKFGKKGMFVGGMFDMGYCFSYALDKGMASTGEEVNWSFAVSHFPQNGGLSDPAVVIEYIKKDMPDFIFAAFCGEESSLFLNTFIEQGLHEQIPILSLPYLLEDYQQTLDKSITIYSSITAGKEMVDLEESWTSNEGLFELLGCETAMVLKEWANGVTMEELKTITFRSDRGDYCVSPEKMGLGCRSFIIKNVHPGDKRNIQRERLEGLETTSIEDKPFVDGLRGVNMTWQNPYLSV